jgi:hypothetical protein
VAAVAIAVAVHGAAASRRAHLPAHTGVSILFLMVVEVCVCLVTLATRKGRVWLWGIVGLLAVTTAMLVLYRLVRLG